MLFNPEKAGISLIKIISLELTVLFLCLLVCYLT
jgi:hypothetical protein